MATYDAYKEHLLQIVGKLFFGQGHTRAEDGMTPAKRPLEERERFDPTIPLPSHMILNLEEIWGHLLPGVPPAADSAEVIVHKNWPALPGETGAWRLAARTDIPNNKCWLATSLAGVFGGELDPRLENWIPAKYGSAWEISVYEDAAGVPGAVIPITHAAGWLFDWQSGMLTFEQDPVALGLTAPFWVKGYRYVGPSAKDVIDGVVAGSAITVEDNVPVAFPGVNILRFGPNFTVTDLGGGRVLVSMVAGSTWPWSSHQTLIVPVDGVVGVPQDFALAVPATVMSARAFVFLEGVKLMFGALKDFTFPNPNTLRILNLAGRPLLQAGQEVEIFYS